MNIDLYKVNVGIGALSQLYTRRRDQVFSRVFFISVMASSFSGYKNYYFFLLFIFMNHSYFSLSFKLDEYLFIYLFVFTILVLHFSFHIIFSSEVIRWASRWMKSVGINEFYKYAWDGAKNGKRRQKILFYVLRLRIGAQIRLPSSPVQITI